MTRVSIDHLLGVGRTKAMGLLTEHEIHACGFSVEAIKNHFNDKSRYIVRVLKPGDRLWGYAVEPGQESVAVASRSDLQRLLLRHRRLLKRVQWPQTADGFFNKSLDVYVLRGNNRNQTRLQNLIKLAYNHKRNKKETSFYNTLCAFLKL